MVSTAISSSCRTAQSKGLDSVHGKRVIGSESMCHMENYKKKLKMVSNSSLSSHWSCLKTPIKCNTSRIKDFQIYRFCITFLISHRRATNNTNNETQTWDGWSRCGFKRKMNHFLGTISQTGLGALVIFALWVSIKA